MAKPGRIMRIGNIVVERAAFTIFTELKLFSFSREIVVFRTDLINK